MTYSGRQIWIEGLRSDSLMLGLLPMTQFVSLAGIFFGLTSNGWLYLWKPPLLDILPSQVKETNLFCK